VLLDLLILMEFVFNVHLVLLLVHQLPMELLVYQDISYQLHGLIVLDVHHKLLHVLLLQHSNHVNQLIMLHLLQDLMLLVPLVQLLEM